ncbi:hypothetical protein V8G54_027857 [Vigna mungo]|uniref:Uncharacterized protein n=1 Tax=Vigna mungo TaxID=3915 RepID=A0AAQ3MRI4_VIGMU
MQNKGYNFSNQQQQNLTKIIPQKLKYLLMFLDARRPASNLASIFFSTKPLTDSLLLLASQLHKNILGIMKLSNTQGNLNPQINQTEIDFISKPKTLPKRGN